MWPELILRPNLIPGPNLIPWPNLVLGPILILGLRVGPGRGPNRDPGWGSGTQLGGLQAATQQQAILAMSNNSTIPIFIKFIMSVFTGCTHLLLLLLHMLKFFVAYA